MMFNLKYVAGGTGDSSHATCGPGEDKTGFLFQEEEAGASGVNTRQNLKKPFWPTKIVQVKSGGEGCSQGGGPRLEL